MTAPDVRANATTAIAHQLADLWEAVTCLTAACEARMLPLPTQRLRYITIQWSWPGLQDDLQLAPLFIEYVNGPRDRPAFSNVTQRRVIALAIVGTTRGDAREASRVLGRLRALSKHVRQQTDRILSRDVTTKTRHSKYVTEIEAIAAAVAMAASKA